MASLWQTLAATEHQIRYVDAAGHRTRVLTAGGGQPLLLLHGTGGHLESYLRNIGALAEKFKVIAIDLLGHGYTDLPHGEHFDWRAVAEHVAATMDDLELPSATWIGEALGAQAAQWAAAKMPNRVDRLVLCCAGIAPADDPADAGVTDAQQAFQELTRRALAEPSAEEVMRARMEWLHLDAGAVDGELLRMRMTIWGRPGFTSAQQRLLGSLRNARQDPRTALAAAETASISVPALLVWTERNPLMAVAVADRLASLLPRARLEIFSKSAMWPQFDESEKFNKVLIDWLGETAVCP